MNVVNVLKRDLYTFFDGPIVRKGYDFKEKGIFPQLSWQQSCKVHIVHREANFLLLVERALKGTTKQRESPVVAQQSY